MRGVVAIPWTDEERRQLRQLHANGLTQPQIAAMLGRTHHSVQRQCRYLGLKGTHNTPIKPRSTKPQPPRRHYLDPAPKSTLPPLPSLSMRGDGECEPC